MSTLPKPHFETEVDFHNALSIFATLSLEQIPKAIAHLRTHLTVNCYRNEERNAGLVAYGDKFKAHWDSKFFTTEKWRTCNFLFNQSASRREFLFECEFEFFKYALSHATPEQLSWLLETVAIYFEKRAPFFETNAESLLQICIALEDKNPGICNPRLRGLLTTYVCEQFKKIPAGEKRVESCGATISFFGVFLPESLVTLSFAATSEHRADLFMTMATAQLSFKLTVPEASSFAYLVTPDQRLTTFRRLLDDFLFEIEPENAVEIIANMQADERKTYLERSLANLERPEELRLFQCLWMNFSKEILELLLKIGTFKNIKPILTTLDFGKIDDKRFNKQLLLLQAKLTHKSAPDDQTRLKVMASTHLLLLEPNSKNFETYNALAMELMKKDGPWSTWFYELGREMLAFARTAFILLKPFAYAIGYVLWSAASTDLVYRMDGLRDTMPPPTATRTAGA